MDIECCEDKVYIAYPNTAKPQMPLEQRQYLDFIVRTTEVSCYWNVLISRCPDRFLRGPTVLSTELTAKGDSRLPMA